MSVHDERYGAAGVGVGVGVCVCVHACTLWYLYSHLILTIVFQEDVFPILEMTI